jgi:hypothetical protein
LKAPPSRPCTREADIPSGTIRAKEDLLEFREEDEEKEVEMTWGDKEIHFEEEFSLRDIEISNDEPALQKAIEGLCVRHRELFCSTVREEPAKFRTPMVIEMDKDKWETDTRALMNRPRIQSDEKSEEIRRQVQLLMKHGCIRESQATKYSQVVLAKKPNNKWRFCIDFC